MKLYKTHLLKLLIMKTAILTICFIFFTNVGWSQQIDKKTVLVEKWSGTWCGPCSGAAKGVEDLLERGAKIAVISYQSERVASQKEKFENKYCKLRAQYYGGISSYPTTRFNGVEVYTKGNAMYSIYDSLKPIYEKQIAQKTSFDINVVACTIEGSKINTQITTQKVADYSGATNLRLHLVLVESEINEKWEGLNQLHFVQRDMQVNDTGVNLDFSKQTNLEHSFEIEINKLWNKDNLELIAFLQDDSSKEVLQTIIFTPEKNTARLLPSHLNALNAFTMSWKAARNINHEIDYYQIYKNDDKFKQVDASTLFYSEKDMQVGKYKYNVAAIYKTSGEATKSNTISVNIFKNNLLARPKHLHIDTKTNSLQWEAPDPIINNNLTYKFYNDLELNSDSTYKVDKKGGVLMETVYVVNAFMPQDLDEQIATTIKQIAFIPIEKATYSAVIFSNHKLIAEEPIKVTDSELGKFKTHQFTSIPYVSNEDTLLIGYKVTNFTSAPIATDFGPVQKMGQSNLIGSKSENGIDWQTLYTGNNILNIGFGLPIFESNTKHSYIFKGYNVYGNDLKLTEVPLSQNEYAISKKNSTYYVTAVYESGESQASDTLKVKEINIEIQNKNNQFKIYPNPVNTNLYVEGENIKSIEILNINGSVLKTQTANNFIDLTDIAKGMYLVRITTLEHTHTIQKIIKN
ncbi:MAG: T9SS type A sorting domain-containing protein [Bacteroidales bacterium]